MQAAVIMGSKSDFEAVRPALETFKRFGVRVEVRVLSAHRTPHHVHDFVKQAEIDGAKVFIAAAGKAAHLAGVVASFTTAPVIGLPIAGTATASFDSLLSMVQMPSGIPVATVAVNGAENSALLALQILAVGDQRLKTALVKHKKDMAEKVLKDNAEISVEVKRVYG